MNTGQMMLTIAAIFLLSMVILTTNRGLLTTNITMAESRYSILGISVATSTIEEATGKAFDTTTDGASITSTNVLTTPDALGIETGENSNNPKGFNDFDDYNCYKTNPKLDTLVLEGTARKIIFNSYCRVDYVDQNNPNNISSSRTWHKRMSVRVISPGMNDTIKMSTVYSYWYFR